MTIITWETFEVDLSLGSNLITRTRRTAEQA